MAGVYIANMKLPTVCDECESGFVHTIGCTKRMFFNDRSIARHPECPLHFVPDHGRLVDADNMFVEFVIEGQGSRRYKPGENWELNGAEIRKVIRELQTVIPADKEM